MAPRHASTINRVRPHPPVAPYNRTPHNCTGGGCLGLFTSQRLQPKLHTAAAPLLPNATRPAACIMRAHTQAKNKPQVDVATGCST
jgi:hypothetical protein